MNGCLEIAANTHQSSCVCAYLKAAQTDRKAFWIGCRIVTDPGCCLFCPSLKEEKKKNQKKAKLGNPRRSFQGILGIPGRLDVEPEQRKQGLLMGCSALSNGPVGFATSLSDGGGYWVGDELLCQGILRDAGRAFPHPIRVLTEASPCCRQPRVLLWWHRFIALCLVCTRELAPYGAISRRDGAGCSARPALGWGAAREPTLLQLALFEVQYFHLLPLMALLPQLRIARHLQHSRSISE